VLEATSDAYFAFVNDPANTQQIPAAFQHLIEDLQRDRAFGSASADLPLAASATESGAAAMEIDPESTAPPAEPESEPEPVTPAAAARAVAQP
jgi:hypothetical protein